MPVAPNFTCDVNALLADSKCFTDLCLGEQLRRAVEIYVRIKNLAASGGADYSADLNALLQASKQYQVLASHQRDAISLWIDLQNAIDNGASIDQNVNALTAASKCYECLGEELQKNVLEYLKCAINSLGKPD